MANARLIKRRIKSAQNISQITKAMELVSASKMKKAQTQALSGKLYADKIREMVATLSVRVDTVSHALLENSNNKNIIRKSAKNLNPLSYGKRLYIFITTNKGLCGGLNTALFRFVIQSEADVGDSDWISLGSKGTSFITQTNKPLLADFSSEIPFIKTVPALTEMVIKEFTSGTCSSVDLIYNEFISALRYEPRIKSLLPIRLVEIGATEKDKQIKDTVTPFLIEPEPQQVFNELLPHYIENQIRDAILEAEASEHSARMVAMRNATDNAMSLMEDLTLVYNKARQEKITYEITDMVTARLAFEGV